MLPCTLTTASRPLTSQESALMSAICSLREGAPLLTTGSWIPTIVHSNLQDVLRIDLRLAQGFPHEDVFSHHGVQCRVQTSCAFWPSLPHEVTCHVVISKIADFSSLRPTSARRLLCTKALPSHLAMNRISRYHRRALIVLVLTLDTLNPKP